MRTWRGRIRPTTSQGLRESVTGALADAARDPGFARDRVIGIGVDTTGSTPLPLDASARPLALDPRFRDNLAAHAWLWKDHTGAEEAAAITAMAQGARAGIAGADRRHVLVGVVVVEDLAVPEGGARGVRRRRHAGSSSPTSFRPCSPASTIRGRSSAASAPRATRRCISGIRDQGSGIRACRRRRFSRGSIRSSRSCATGCTTRRCRRERPPGTLCREWAGALGLPEGIVIAMGGFDAHYGAVGSGIAPGTLVKIIGTSTCDCAIAPVGGRDRATSPASAASSTARSCRATTASRRVSRRSATS